MVRCLSRKIKKHCGVEILYFLFKNCAYVTNFMLLFSDFAFLQVRNIKIDSSKDLGANIIDSVYNILGYSEKKKTKLDFMETIQKASV